MADREQRLAIVVVARDMASRSLRSISKELGGMDKAARYVATRGVKGIGTAISNIEHAAVGLGAMAIGAGAAAVKMAGDFEAGMNTINTVALATPEVLARAGEGIRSIYRQTGQSLEDLQAAEYDLVSAGVKLQDAQGGLAASVKLGLGAYGSTAEAVDVLTTAINAYNLKAADGTIATQTWTKVSDELAQAVADGKVKLTEIAASYADVAAVAAQAGVGTDEIAAAYAFLTAKGVPAAEVTTQMSRALLELQKPSAAVIKLQKDLKKNYADIAAEKGLNVALQELAADADKAKVPLVNLFGRVEGYKYLLQTTGPNAAGFNAELAKIRSSAGMTQKQFDARAQGLNYQLGVFKANVYDAAISVGQELIPQLTDLAKEGSTWLQSPEGQARIKAFAKDVGTGFREAVKWAKSLPWDQIAGALKAGGEGAQMIAKAFLSMPPDIQKMLLGLFGANKLTGGAVSDIGGALVKGMLGETLGRLGKSGIFGRGSSPMAPVYTKDVGGLGGGVPGMPATGGMGGITKLAVTAGSVLLAGDLVLQAGQQFQQFLSDVSAEQAATDKRIADALEKVSPADAIKGLVDENRAIASTLADPLQGPIAKIWAAGQMKRDLAGLGETILKGQKSFSAQQTKDAIAALYAAQHTALGAGWLDTAKSLAEAIKVLRGQVPNPQPQTAASGGTGDFTGGSGAELRRTGATRQSHLVSLAAERAIQSWLLGRTQLPAAQVEAHASTLLGTYQGSRTPSVKSMETELEQLRKAQLKLSESPTAGDREVAARIGKMADELAVKLDQVHFAINAKNVGPGATKVELPGGQTTTSSSTGSGAEMHGMGVKLPNPNADVTALLRSNRGAERKDLGDVKSAVNAQGRKQASLLGRIADKSWSVTIPLTVQNTTYSNTYVDGKKVASAISSSTRTLTPRYGPVAS